MVLVGVATASGEAVANRRPKRPILRRGRDVRAADAEAAGETDAGAGTALDAEDGCRNVAGHHSGGLRLVADIAGDLERGIDAGGAELSVQPAFDDDMIVVLGLCLPREGEARPVDDLGIALSVLLEVTPLDGRVAVGNARSAGEERRRGDASGEAARGRRRRTGRRRGGRGRRLRVERGRRDGEHRDGSDRGDRRVADELHGNVSWLMRQGRGGQLAWGEWTESSKRFLCYASPMERARTRQSCFYPITN